jgi:hypothetical protein
MPVATKAIWLVIAVLSIATFLFDVAVRRVRIDPEMIAAAVARLFRSQKQAVPQQIDTLRQARDKARRTIDARAADKAVSSTKFEASAEQLRSASLPTETPGAASAPIQIKTEKPTDPSKPAEGGDGMSRLLKAKKRAQDDMSDQ